MVCLSVGGKAICLQAFNVVMSIMFAHAKHVRLRVSWDTLCF